MKKHIAFFPAEHLRICEKALKEIFNLSLLTYDRIYSRIFNYKKLLDHRVIENYEDIFKVDDNNHSLLDGNTFAFIMYYLDKDVKVARKLIKEGTIKCIYQDGRSDFKDNFIKEVFQDPIMEGHYSFVLPCAEMFVYIYDNLVKQMPKRFVDKDLSRIISMVQDVIISVYYKKKYNMDMIYSTGHLLLMEQLQRMSVYTFTDYMTELQKEIQGFFGVDFSTVKIAKYYKDTREMFSFNGLEKQGKIEMLFSEIVPDFSRIPVDVIYSIKKKDRFRSLPALAEKLSVSKEITDEDLIKYFNEEAWKFANRSMKISLPEVVFNILGWVQVEPEIGLGIQLFSQSNIIKSVIDKYEHSGWIIPVYKLREEGKKYFIMHDHESTQE